jgi:excisionase family DNA binding protein
MDEGRYRTVCVVCFWTLRPQYRHRPSKVVASRERALPWRWCESAHSRGLSPSMAAERMTLRDLEPYEDDDESGKRYTIQEAARRLGRAVKTVYALAQNHRLGTVVGGRRMLSADDIDALRRRQRSPRR